MVFPQTGRNVLVEMLTGSGWTNITDDVYQRDGIDITRGRSEYASQVAPQSCALTLDNRLGKYSPRNPLSQYYGQIGRNTQIRVAIQTDPVYDAYSSTTGTGDLSWTHTPVGNPTGVCVFVWQYNTSGALQIASVTYGGVEMERKIFGLFTFGAVNAVGYMYWLNRDIPPGPQTVVVDTTVVAMRQASAITVTGGTNAEIDALSSAYSNATPSANPFLNLTTFKRAHLFGSLLSELDDGSTISAGGGYTQLGEHDLGTETVNVMRTNVVQNPATWSVPWTAASAHWGIMAVAIRAVYYRFWGEVSSFPARWDTSGNDAHVPIEAAGILRRLGQGVDPPSSGLQDVILASPGVYNYWPLTGQAGTQYSLNIVPGAYGGDRYFSEGASFKYGETYSTFLGTGMALFNSDAGPMRGDIGAFHPNAAVDFVYQSAVLGNFFLTCYDYSGFIWTVQLDGGTGIAQVSITDPDLGPIGFSPTGVLPELLDSNTHHVRLKLLQNGTATDWVLYIDGVSVDSGSHAAYNLDGMSIFRMQYTRTSTQSWVVLGHITIWSDATETWPTAASLTLAMNGYTGEAAGTRIARIADLGGHDLTTVGTLSDTEIMGPQYSESMLTQLRDAEGTDLGVLAEPRDAFGLLYRTHRSLYNQDPTVTLQYDSGHLAPPFEPVDDDRLTRNDITAVRRDGDTYRLKLETGALSILDPPSGVGRYKDEVTVNVETDGQLPAVAGWLLHVGTLAEARYPSVRINLANSNVVAAGLEAAVLATDIGDRIVIQDANDVNIYDDISLIALGCKERILEFEHDVTFNCAPGSTYEVLELDDPDSRISSGDTSELSATMTTTATSMSVLSADAVTLWTTDAGQMPIPIMVAGEEMSVTAISGTTPGVAQTFTVTRSVNGVVKTHAVGEVVRLKRDAVVAL